MAHGHTALVTLSLVLFVEAAGGLEKNKSQKEPGLPTSSASCQLCDLGRVTSLLWASVPSVEKRSSSYGFKSETLEGF